MKCYIYTMKSFNTLLGMPTNILRKLHHEEVEVLNFKAKFKWELFKML